jgi:replicative DNA helicase
VDLALQSLNGVLEEADGKLRTGTHAASRAWPTGFNVLDKHLSGGFRAGELILVSGAQSLGKTTWSLQLARNVARAGRPVVFFSFEHDPQNLLIRIVSMEAGEIGGVEAPPLIRIRESFEAADGRSGSIVDRLRDTACGAKAIEAVQEYAERLVLHRSTGSSTTLAAIWDAVEEVRRDTGELPLVVVDYLQKVKLSGPTKSEEDRITTVVEGLKDLALELDIPVVAVVAADKAVVGAGKRMRVSDLRGSAALASEADTVLMLNNKYDVVARHHLMYNLGAAERFREWAVLTIEKNRSGKDGIDLEFQKRFEQGRFESSGQRVSEQLVDERIFVE